MNLLTSNKKTPYFIIVFSIALCLILGIWWLYLIYSLSITLHDVAPRNLFYMIIAEGSTFFILLIVTILSTLILLRNEQQKFISMQKFYAIFSHELKTPLTTIQLQTEILPSILESNTVDREKLRKVISRLVSSSRHLKDEVEKMLTLSQLALSPSLPSESIDLEKFIEHWKTKLTTKRPIILINSSNEKCGIRANTSALETIMNNLLQNTERHSLSNSSISITTSSKDQKYIHITYEDHGHIQGLSQKKLGELFYKSPSSTGSGLGLFIIKHMMVLMGGKALFKNSHGKFQTHLFFRKE